ncbi:hypothetical protein EB73_09725 [Mycobacterium sp. SWH-M3]|nr:hypothetical protein EB73_09725 [Mycobacterium sp. SWH-M3]
MAATKTKKRAVAPTREEAMARLKEAPVIDLADLAVLTGVSMSTIHRQVSGEKLPVPTARIGQRWIVPTAPVREWLKVSA